MLTSRAPASRRVRADQFRPDTGTSMIDPVARLADLSSQMQIHPGRAPGGSGETGVGRWDANGYRQMLQDRQEYLALQDYMGGGNGINTATGPDRASTRTLNTATGHQDRGSFGMGTGADNAVLEGLDAAATTGTPEGQQAARTERTRLNASRYARLPGY
jgi:hypothetical protein